MRKKRNSSMKGACNTSSIKLVSILAISTLLTAFAVANEGNTSSQSAWNAPPSAKTLKNPVAATPESISLAKTMYAQQCAVCHGKSGKGDGPSAQYLGKPLPDFTGVNFSEQLDGEIFWKVTNGNSPMPAFEKILSEEQRWQLINFIRTFNKKK